MTSKTDADFLFPTPTAPPHPTAPARWPGITPQSVQVLKKLLKDNHERWHIFFNEQGFHNHSVHRMLAVWALGADGAIIEAGYKTDSSYQKPLHPSPGSITAQNFRDYLGESRYWEPYCKFFTEETRKLGMREVLEKYIFSREFNFDGKLKDEEQPRMLDRFVSGVLHPLIHSGHGYEFGLPGIVAEGLALTALHKPAFKNTITPDLFDKVGAKSHSGITTALAKELDITSPSKPSGIAGAKPTHALTIVARILKDARFAEAKHLNQDNFDTETGEKFGSIIREYMDQWDIVDTSDPKEVMRKVEELVWTNVVFYGICGWQEKAPFRANFFLIHPVTSSLFLPSLLAFLSPPSQALLLRSYFAASLSCWISRGRPKIDIKGFYSSSSATAYPLPSGSLPTPAESTLPLPDADPNRLKAVTPTPWLPIIETSLVHPDDHLIKIQRTLAHYSSLYGARGQGAREGGLQGAAEELEGAELLDGTLFIRVAGLTAQQMGRVREGEPKGEWDFKGFLED